MPGLALEGHAVHVWQRLRGLLNSELSPGMRFQVQQGCLPAGGVTLGSVTGAGM